MSHPLEARLRSWDPSLGLAVVSILRCIADHGSARFGALAVAYRDDHLELQRKQIGSTVASQTLSVDDVRRHLEGSVLPRLVTEHILERVPQPLEDDTPIQFAAAVWDAMGSDVQSARDQLLDIVADTMHQAEPTRPKPMFAESGPRAQLMAQGLTKVYRKRAVVDNVDLSVTQGEIVGLLGPNGAGKTTSFYMIVGLISPDKGEVTLDGDNISGLPMYQRARRGIGYLAQEPSVFRKLSVEDNILAILETMKLNHDERIERAETLLDELSIKHLRKVPAYKLSGGERRRLEITRALVTQPRFMLLDEPFAGVDPIAVHDIQTIVTGLRQRGIGVLITDHNVEQTLDIVDRAYIMFEGSVQVSGTVRELVYDDRVADLYLGPTLTARLRQRLESAA